MAQVLHKDIVGDDVHVIGYAQATDPGAVGAHKAWIDTSGTPVLKVRNAANTAWLSLGGVTDAADLAFTPAAPANWTGSSDPGDTADALDQLASRITTEEGTKPVTEGGTGITSYTTGDLIYASAATTLAKLAATTNGFFLKLVGGLPAWQALTLYYQTLKDSGSSLAQRSVINFINGLGTTPVLADDAGNDETEVKFDLDINGLTADGTPDGATDYLATYDASAGTHKKVLLSNLPISGGGLDDLNTDTTETEVANTTTETTVYTYTVPGGTLSTNKLLVLLLPFSILSNGGVNPTLTIKVKYGSTTVITHTSVGLQVFGTVLGGDLRIYLFGDGATNAQEAVLQGTSDSNASHKYTGTGTAAEDSTGDLALVVTVQWSHANANISFIMKSAVLLGPYAP